MRSERQRQAEYGRLQRVVYSRAETAADIAPAAVPVQGRQNADRIDYQYAGSRRISLRGQLRIAEGRTTDAADQTLDPARVDLVRHDDELDVAVAIDHPEQQFFVGRPCAPRHENGRPAAKRSISGNRLARAAIEQTRSKRVSPVTDTQRTPMRSSNARDSSFCTKIWLNAPKARRNRPP